MPRTTPNEKPAAPAVQRRRRLPRRMSPRRQEDAGEGWPAACLKISFAALAVMLAPISLFILYAKISKSGPEVTKTFLFRAFRFIVFCNAVILAPIALALLLDLASRASFSWPLQGFFVDFRGWMAQIPGALQVPASQGLVFAGAVIATSVVIRWLASMAWFRAHPFLFHLGALPVAGVLVAHLARSVPSGIEERWLQPQAVCIVLAALMLGSAHRILTRLRMAFLPRIRPAVGIPLSLFVSFGALFLVVAAYPSVKGKIRSWRFARVDAPMRIDYCEWYRGSGEPTSKRLPLRSLSIVMEGMSPDWDSPLLGRASPTADDDSEQILVAVSPEKMRFLLSILEQEGVFGMGAVADPTAPPSDVGKGIWRELSIGGGAHGFRIRSDSEDRGHYDAIVERLYRELEVGSPQCVPASCAHAVLVEAAPPVESPAECPDPAFDSPAVPMP
mgnify:CR=1 FL=1